jgi:hypothetical protein
VRYWINKGESNNNESIQDAKKRPLSSPSAISMSNCVANGSRKAAVMCDRNAANGMASMPIAMRFVVTTPSLSKATSEENTKHGSLLKSGPSPIHGKLMNNGQSKLKFAN